jgi:hypothetical protein
MRSVFITTMKGTEIDLMGYKLFESWEKYANEDCVLYVLLNKTENLNLDTLKKFKNVYYEFLTNDYHYYDFIEKIKDIPEAKGRILVNNQLRYEYRYDVVRFCHKIFALSDGLKFLRSDDDFYIWLDADVYLTNNMSTETFSNNLKPLNWLAAYLGRKDWDHTETGIIIFNNKNNNMTNFVKDMVKMYLSGNVFKLTNGRTDSFIFDLVRQFYENELKEKFLNISNNVDGMHVWPKTFLNNFSVHLKGIEAKIKENVISQDYINDLSGTKQTKENNEIQMKEKEKSEQENENTLIINTNSVPSMMQRYKQLYMLIEKMKPVIITEVGVGNGDRAEEMIRSVFKKSNRCVYFGFDLFEDATEEINREELNSKKTLPMYEIHKRLLKLQEEFPNLFFTLYKGNTRETLQKFVDKEVILSNSEGLTIAVKPSQSDFVFIDGGHSIETIRNDYSHFEKCPIVVIDDYYEPDEQGRMPDITKYGANFLLNKYKNLKLLPVKDRIVEGGLVRFVLGGLGAEKIEVKSIETNNEKDIVINKDSSQKEQTVKTINFGNPQPGDKKAGISIQTRNALSNEDLQAQIEKNCLFMKEKGIEEFKICKNHNLWACLVGGSSSYKKDIYFNKLRKASESRDEVVFASKTSHDYMISKGVIPFGCILLDPRPHVINCFTPDKRVTYFVASQCHSSVFEKLYNHGCKMYVYHAAVAAGEEKVILKILPEANILPGGSTSQMRGLVLLMGMGFSRFRFFGLDSSYPEKPEKVHGINQEKQPLYIEIASKRTKKPLGRFWTDPELLAQINDIEHMIKMFANIEIDCQSEGLMKAVLENSYVPKNDFVKFYGFKT